MTDTIKDARAYVATSPLSGFAQLALVERVGIEGTALLEIGCGSLHFAKAFLAMRGYGIQYCGMDPNEWLRAVARHDDPVLDRLCKDYDVQFSTGIDFDGRAAFGQTFDMVFSHSVLSHVGHDGLRQFMAGAAQSLRRHGVLLASVNLARPGWLPTIGDDWSYPRAVTVHPGELREALVEHGFGFEVRTELRELYMSWCPKETHDWIMATKLREP